MERKPRGLMPRVAASQSFTEDEVNVLDAIVLTILRGGDAKILARSPAARSLMQKVQRMKASVERTKALRAKTLATTPEQCICEDSYAERFDANPTGHYVNCPLWGTTHPNRNDVASGIEQPESAQP
jgi:hypothetical protein